MGASDIFVGAIAFGMREARCVRLGLGIDQEYIDIGQIHPSEWSGVMNARKCEGPFVLCLKIKTTPAARVGSHDQGF